jgi:hypothetical protein
LSSPPGCSRALPESNRTSLERDPQRVSVALDAILAREHVLHLLLLAIPVEADRIAAHAADGGADRRARRRTGSAA